MNRRVSLRAVETFVAAARALSLTLAARELGLTTSAVSRRISELELDLGVDLFHRLNRRIELTPSGARYLASVGEAIDRIHAGSAALGADRARKVVRLACIPEFASAWLMPRLARFRTVRPDIEVELSTGLDIDQPALGEANAGLFFGAGHWPGLIAEPLVGVEVSPICAPQLAPANRRLTPEALDRFTLLSIAPVFHLWEEWFAAAGLAGYRPAQVKVFDSVQVAYEAAAAGMGLALGGSCLADRWLEAGRLVPAFDRAPLRSSSGWHLVCRARDRDWAPLKALSRALLADVSVLAREPA